MLHPHVPCPLIAWICSDDGVSGVGPIIAAVSVEEIEEEEEIGKEKATASLTTRHSNPFAAASLIVADIAVSALKPTNTRFLIFLLRRINSRSVYAKADFDGWSIMVSSGVFSFGGGGCVFVPVLVAVAVAVVVEDDDDEESKSSGKTSVPGDDLTKKGPRGPGVPGKHFLSPPTPIFVPGAQK